MQFHFRSLSSTVSCLVFLSQQTIFQTLAILPYFFSFAIQWLHHTMPKSNPHLLTRSSLFPVFYLSQLLVSWFQCLNRQDISRNKLLPQLQSAGTSHNTRRFARRL